MDEKLTTIMELVKARLGVSSNIRDAYIEAIIKGVIQEMEKEKGLSLDQEDDNHLLFVVDYSSWRYLNRDKEGSMPRHIQFRLHNLMISARGEADV